MSHNDDSEIPMQDVEGDDGGRTEDGSRAPPQQRQHKYTTANLRPERPWKRWCLICLAFLVVIAIMVLISIFLQRLFDPPEDEDWSDDQAAMHGDDLAGVVGELSGEAALFPKRVGFLDNVCAVDKIGEAGSREACEDACAPASGCCDPFADGNSTCFIAQTAGCLVYSQCHALEGAIDPAWDTLHRVCNKASIEIDRQDCENACAAMRCCYKGTDNCVAQNFQACLDYAPCQNLRLPEGDEATEEDASSSIIYVAPADLDDNCKDKENMCLRDCREALCCGDPNSACYRDNFLSCLTHAACNQFEEASPRIKVAPMNSVVPRAPGNLIDVCLESFRNTNGNDACQEACSDSACCFDGGATGCFGNDPLGCMEYRMCSIFR